MSTKPVLHVHTPTLDSGDLTCTYTVNDEHFASSYHFPNPQVSSNSITQKLCEWAAIVTSFGLFNITYFDEILCDFIITNEERAFFEKLIFHGFGEFRLTNNIDITKTTVVRGNSPYTAAQPLAATGATTDNGPLLLNGGGKDGSVSAYLLESADRTFTWFQRGRSAAQTNVVGAWHAPVVCVDRQLDPGRANRAYSGHRPISAALAFVSLLAAHLSNYSAVIASNEASANEGNATIDGFQVNHQYSKSFEFEQDIQQLLACFGITLRYFSLLRPLHELQISFLATRLSKPQLAAITSCNHGTKTGTWCMACAKCAFVVLAITAASTDTAEAIWGDRAAINRPGLQQYLIELLDPNVDKPLECVGTLAECQLAAHLILTRHSDILTDTTRQLLAKYADLRDPARDSTSITALGPSAIPETYRSVIQPVAGILNSLT